MPLLLILIILSIAIPIAWLLSEFYSDRPARIALGVLAIATSFGIASLVGSIVRGLEGMRANVYFSEATKDLIQNTIIELENNRPDVVLRELKNLRSEFRPTYETRDEYDTLVDRYIHAISSSPVEHEGGAREWSHELQGDKSTTADTSPAPPSAAPKSPQTDE